MMNVPFYSLDYVNRALGDALRESFSDVLDSKWFIRGNRCREFEDAFAAYCGKKACVGVGNGLDALTLMLRASIQLGRLQQGDEVIVPANRRRSGCAGEYLCGDCFGGTCSGACAGSC